MLRIVIVVILLLALLGSFPGGPYPGAANWGYWPSGGLGLVLVVVLIVFLLGGGL